MSDGLLAGKRLRERFSDQATGSEMTLLGMRREKSERDVAKLRDGHPVWKARSPPVNPASAPRSIRDPGDIPRAEILIVFLAEFEQLISGEETPIRVRRPAPRQRQRQDDRRCRDHVAHPRAPGSIADPV